MKKLIKKENCGSINSAWMHCSQKIGQKLWLLFMYRTWTVAACGGKTREKKKKKKKGKTQKCNAAKRTLYPNITLIIMGLVNKLKDRLLKKIMELKQPISNSNLNYYWCLCVTHITNMDSIISLYRIIKKTGRECIVF